MFGGEGKADKYISALLRRQRGISTTATCRTRFAPAGTESAGMAVVQSMNHQFHLERVTSDGRKVIHLVRTSAEYPCALCFPGFTSITTSEVVAEAEWDADDIVMQIDINGETFTIRYGRDRDTLATLCVADGALIKPQKVGCMAGTMIGMFASGNGTESDNVVTFGWFELS